jgi:putative protease
MTNTQNIAETEIKKEPFFLFCLDSFEDLDKVADAKPDAVVFGLKGFCGRIRAAKELEEMEETIRFFHARQMQVYINLQKMIEQQEAGKTKEILEALEKSGADGYYIADEGWIETADAIDPSLALRNKLVFQPETLIASGQEAQFYIECNLRAVSLAHELSLEEIVKCAKACKDLEVLISGRYAWMDSRRPLLSNYFEHMEQPEKFTEEKIYFLQEKTRQDKMPVWQDAAGTHVISAEPVCSFEQIQALQEGGIARFRIDALLQGNAWAADALNKYKAILEGKNIERRKEDGSDALYKTQTQIQK